MGRPRNRKPYTRQTPRYVMPAGLTPAVTFGDVVMAMQPSTWQPIRSGRDLLATLRALYSALAACARVTPREAVTIKLEEALTGRLMLPTRNGLLRPVFLLPAVLKLVKKAKKLRPAGADPELFVSTGGTKLPRQWIENSMSTLGLRWGFHGGALVGRFHEFFDACFVDEDECAVAVLRRIGAYHGKQLPHREVELAAKDEDMLLVLMKRHALAGEAGTLIGPRGIAAARDTVRLFVNLRPCWQARSEAMDTDEVCIALERTPWPATRQREFRKVLVDAHFDHTETLRLAGRLSTADQAFLFKVRPDWLMKRRSHIRAAGLSPELRAAKAEWTAGLPALFTQRPRGETVREFHDRLRPLAPQGIPCVLLATVGVLQRAGVLDHPGLARARR